MLALVLSGLCGTAQAQDYTETISGFNDNYKDDIKTNDKNGNYTYTFQAGDSLTVSNMKDGTKVGIDGGIAIIGTYAYDDPKYDVKKNYGIVTFAPEYSGDSEG